MRAGGAERVVIGQLRSVDEGTFQIPAAIISIAAVLFVDSSDGQTLRKSNIQYLGPPSCRRVNHATTSVGP